MKQSFIVRRMKIIDRIENLLTQLFFVVYNRIVALEENFATNP